MSPRKKVVATYKGMPVRQPRKSAVPYFLILPAVAILIIALGYPLYWQFKTSMEEYGLLQYMNPNAPATFVGFQNYIDLASDPVTWAVVGRSIAFCAVNAILTVLIGVLVALLMNAVNKVARLILQIAMLLAWAMPLVAAVTVWEWLFDDRNGVINFLLGTENHKWLTNPLSFFMVATFIIVWMSVPFVAFSVFAGLTQVSGEIVEASEIDGANAWQRFWGITIPMIRPVLTIVLLLQIIWDLRVFAQINMLQQAGGTVSETNLLGTYIYQLGMGSQNFAMASAFSIFVLALTIALSAFYVVQLLKEDS